MNWVILLKILVLCLVSLVATIVDTIAGGGGLLTLPALLLFGLAPADALATNKVQSSVGSTTAAITFIRQDNMDMREFLYGIAWCLIGTSVGTCLVLALHHQSLSKLLPWIILSLFLYMLLAKDKGCITQRALMSRGCFFLCVWFGAGIL